MSDSNTSVTGGIVHAFHSREDLEVRFDLPIDLNPQEAKRLSMWIRSLPFMADDDGF